MEKTTLKYAYKILDVIVYGIGATLSLGGMVMLAIPFILGNMDYWPECIIGIIPLTIGSVLAYLKIRQYDKMKTNKENQKYELLKDKQNKDHELKLKELELKYTIKVETYGGK